MRKYASSIDGQFHSVFCSGGASLLSRGAGRTIITSILLSSNALPCVQPIHLCYTPPTSACHSLYARCSKVASEVRYRPPTTTTAKAVKATSSLLCRCIHRFLIAKQLRPLKSSVRISRSRQRSITRHTPSLTIRPYLKIVVHSLTFDQLPKHPRYMC